MSNISRKYSKNDKIVYRSHTCNQLSINNINQKVILSGWIKAKRDHGDLIFIDLYDFTGVTQLVCDTSKTGLINELKNVARESVIKVEGQVIKRSLDNINENIYTGGIEVEINKLCILNMSKNILPFEIHNCENVDDELKLKYRYLEIRGDLNNVLLQRSSIINQIRSFMEQESFVEVETPILTKQSPEGARDFIVPSRLHPGKFYALPQSPQIYKQLLMVGGVDKYYQIAKCFRDEDLRADRAMEFTQLDIEMSFVDQQDVFSLINKLIKDIFNYNLEIPFIPYKEAMEKYGTDKPDLRNPIILNDITHIIENTELSMFVKAIKKGAVVKSIPAPGAANNTRKFFDDTEKYAKVHCQAKGLAYIQKKDGEYIGPIAKIIDANACDKIFELNGLKDGDSVFFACEKYDRACYIAGVMRNYIGGKLDIFTKENKFEFCWIVDFPFFTYDDSLKKVDFNHNPFSMPYVDTKDILSIKDDREKLDIKAKQYDLVCNGYEIASGAIRNHTPEGLYNVFASVGYEKDYVDEKFAGLIEGLKYGAPPHGGIALGIDRIIMLLTNINSIRKVVAFTNNQKGQDHLMNGPSIIDQNILNDLGVKLEDKK